MADVGMKVLSGCPRYKVVSYLGYDIHVPVWAEWVATDEDGLLYCYAKQPEAEHTLCDLCGHWEPRDGDYKELGKIKLTGLIWEESLREV